MADTTQNILINIDLETGQVNNQLNEIDQKLGSLGQNTKVDSFQSVRSEIQKAREEAVRLAIAIEDAEAAGQNVDKLSERYTEVTSRAAQLTDAVEEVNQSIANANPDNRLQGLVSIAQGAITAIQGVAGAFTLIGVDAETAQVAVAKLQGLIALTDAIGSIDKITKGYRDLVSVINLSAIAQKANNAATAAAAVIQRAFTGSVVATGTAFKVLRTAIISTGIGALVVALGFAIAALIDLAESQSDVEKASSDAADAIEKEKQALDDLSETISNRNRVEIAQLKARGATEKQIRDFQLAEAYSAYVRAFELRQKAAETYNKNIQNADAETLKRLTANLDQAIKDSDKLYSDYLQLGYNNRAADLADEKRVQDEKLQKQREINEKRKQDLKDLNDFTEEQRQLEKRRFQTDLENQITEINKRFERAIQLARAYGRSTVELERLRQSQIQAATREQLRRAEEFSINQTLEFVKKQTEQVSQEISSLLRKKPLIPVDEFIKVTNQFNEVVNLNYKARLRQAELERDALFEQIDKLYDVSSPEGRAAKQKAINLVRSNFETVVSEIEKQKTESQTGFLDLLNTEQIKQNVSVAQQQLDTILKTIEEFKIRVQSTTPIFPFELILGTKLKERTLKLIDDLKQSNQALFKTIANSIEDEVQRVNEIIKRNEISLIDREAFTKALAILEEFDRQREQSIIEGTDREAELTRERDIKLDEINNRRNLRLREIDIRLAKEKLDREEITNKQLLDLERRYVAEQLQVLQPLFTFAPGQSSFTRNFLTSKTFRKTFDDALAFTRDYYDAEAKLETARYQQQLAELQKNNQNTEQLTREHFQKLAEIERNYAQDVQLLNISVADARLELFNSIANIFGATSQLFTKNKKQQVNFAIAEIAVNQATSLVRAIGTAQQAAAAGGPAAPFIVAAVYAQQVAQIIASVARAKQLIASIGESTTGGGNTTAPTTTTPTAINASLFNLPPEAQNVRVVNQASQVVRAYITNDDLRSAQERQQFLNKLSSF